MQTPQWKIGLALIVVGAAAGAFLGRGDVNTAFGRGFAFGSGAARLAMIVIGAGMIITHFIRKNKDNDR